MVARAVGGFVLFFALQTFLGTLFLLAQMKLAKLVEKLTQLDKSTRQEQNFAAADRKPKKIRYLLLRHESVK